MLSGAQEIVLALLSLTTQYMWLADGMAANFSKTYGVLMMEASHGSNKRVRHHGTQDGVWR